MLLWTETGDSSGLGKECLCRPFVLDIFYSGSDVFKGKDGGKEGRLVSHGAVLRREQQCPSAPPVRPFAQAAAPRVLNRRLSKILLDPQFVSEVR